MSKRSRSGYSSHRPGHTSSRQRSDFVPGVTRTAGLYQRSRPNSGEKKFVDGTLASAGVITTTNFISLNQIAQNASASGRIGNKVTLKNLNVRFDITLPHDQSSDIFRYIIYLDKQCNGAAITGPTDILATAAYDSYRNMETVDRFDFLVDKMMAINHTAAGFTRRIAFHYAWKGNIPLTFGGVDGTITQIRSENIGMLCITKMGIVSDLTGKFRIKFVE